MSTPPTTTPHNVSVEGFEDERIEDSVLQNRVASGGLHTDKLNSTAAYGYWLEFLTLLFLALASYGLFHSRSLVLENKGFLVSAGFVWAGLVAAVLVSNSNEKLTGLRLTIAGGLILVGLLSAGISICYPEIVNNAWPTAIAFGCIITSWSLLRLPGETLIRCVSFGAVVAVPILVSFGGTGKYFIDSCRRITSWFIAAFFDLYTVTYTETEIGFKVLGGSFSTFETTPSYAGIVSLVGLSLGLSLILKQSATLTILSAFSVIGWWSIFRSMVCIAAFQNEQMNGMWDSVPMSFYAWICLIILSAATQIFISFFFASIPLDDYDFEHPMLAQLYNLLVNFPQTGPRSRKLFAAHVRTSTNEWDSASNGLPLPNSGHHQGMNSLDIDSAIQEEDWEPLVTAPITLARSSSTNTNP